MTAHCLLTVIAPLAADKVDAVNARIEALLGNPARPEIRDALAAQGRFCHFMSLFAARSTYRDAGFLILEISADGAPAATLARVDGAIGKTLEAIFESADDYLPPFAYYLGKHRVDIGYGLMSTPGLTHVGNPGMSVERILGEARLAARVRPLVGGQPKDLRPLERLIRVRRVIENDDSLAPLVTQTPPPPIVDNRDDPGPLLIAWRLLPSALGVFLWPLVALALLLTAFLVMAMPLEGNWFEHLAGVFGRFVFAFLVAVAAPLLGLYLALRRQEKTDWTDERTIDPSVLDAIMQRENHTGFAQNHMVSVTRMKPGLVRRLTIRVAFWAIAKVGAQTFKPGYLGDIGTIHFARWVTVPGTRDFVFMSNYGGSWESYLEDFITKAHNGLTGVWSNTQGFPRSNNLFLDGATDGERFKRYARRSMTPTYFWYSAYPDLSTENIRTNAAIRRGLAAAMTDEEAQVWLSLFGGARRPDSKLETSEIQSLVFGGLGFKPDGSLLRIALSPDPAEARRFVAALTPLIAFGDGRYTRGSAAVTCALGPSGLRKLGLDEMAIGAFPAAFRDGMTMQARSRVLGDLGDEEPRTWAWGETTDDLVLLVYGETPAAAEAAVADIERKASDGNCAVAGRIVLTHVPEAKHERKEPFGFLDGVSQPAMRGTYRGLRNPDSIHLVAPGEFLLGYRDDRGNFPPGPTLDAAHDPEHVLPIAMDDADGRAAADLPRDIGRNGSFLVIRQLHQYVDAFREYCEAEAERLADRLPPPYEMTAEFIAARMIGRWQDGSSIVRYPYISATEMARRAARGESPGAGETLRPKTVPFEAGGSAIEKPPAPLQPSVVGVDGQDRRDGPAPIRPDNDFLFGVEDPEGVRCPFGSHVRRANPRDSLSPGSQDQIDISNRHRILRVGRGYGGDGSVEAMEGLMFMCLNADIERQFEFIQQTWMVNTRFHGLTDETDPIVVDGGEKGNGFTVPTRDGPVALRKLPRFTRMRGGGYFFLPSRRLLAYLSDSAGSRAAL